MHASLVGRFPGLRWLSPIDAVILLTLCWTIFQFVQPSSRSARPPRPPAPPIAMNRTVSLPGVDWSAATTTVAVAFTLACHYCQASGHFYRSLAAEVKAHPRQRLLILSPDPKPSVAAWMHSQGVDTFEHVNENFAFYGFRLTPTLALIDNRGRVTDIAVGKLSSTEEAQVLARLDGAAEVPLSIRVDSLLVGGAK